MSQPEDLLTECYKRGENRKGLSMEERTEIENYYNKNQENPLKWGSQIRQG